MFDSAGDPTRVNGHRIYPHDTSVDPIVLWRLQGSLDELTCIVRSTSYGYTLSLELAGEPILLELQKNAETLVKKASRLEAWLLTQGWARAADETC